MPDDEGWLTHLSSGVMSHFQITSANLLHHKGKAKAFKPSLIYYYSSLYGSRYNDISSRGENVKMKRISLEVISFIVSIMALLAAAQFSYSVYVGYCVIFEIFAFLFLLICLEIHQTRERWNTIGFDFHTHINVCFGGNDTNCR